MKKIVTVPLNDLKQKTFIFMQVKTSNYFFIHIFEGKLKISSMKFFFVKDHVFEKFLPYNAPLI